MMGKWLSEVWQGDLMMALLWGCALFYVGREIYEADWRKRCIGLIFIGLFALFIWGIAYLEVSFPV